MGKTGLLAFFAALVLVLAGAVVFPRPDDAVSTVRPPALGPPPAVAETAGGGSPGGRSVSAEEQEARIGSFERVAAPEYEILERTDDEREGARGALLLVDTRSRNQEDLTLITRDVKARYGDLDAVTLRFIDSETVLDYNGGAVIFNTPTGAYYAGYVYGPPNTRGYLVDAAE